MIRARNSNLTGVWTALITPFKRSGDLDLPAFRKLLRFQIKSKLHGVVVAGTTGESPTLTFEEKRTLLEAAIAECTGTSCGVIFGSGTNSTRETCELSRWASGMGKELGKKNPLKGLLVVTPYYNKPTAPGLRAHFKAVADVSSLPVLLYNVPGRTGVSLPIPVVLDLAKHPNIHGIKEASGNLNYVSDLIAALGERGTAFNLLSGDDPTFYFFQQCGGHGVISVASHLAPKPMLTLLRARSSAQALPLHLKWQGKFASLFLESNPGPVKQLLADQGWCEPTLRLPLVEMQPEHKARLRAHWKVRS